MYGIANFVSNYATYMLTLNALPPVMWAATWLVDQLD